MKPPCIDLFCGFTVHPISRPDADGFIKQHYLRRWPGVVVLKLGLFSGHTAIGVVVFALPPRETAKRYGVKVWELARLFIVDETPKNSETWFVSRAIRYIQKHHVDVGAIVSYADPSAGHSGIIYRAGNWISDGRTDQGRKTPRFDYRVGDKVLAVVPMFLTVPI